MCYNAEDDILYFLFTEGDLYEYNLTSDTFSLISNLPFESKEVYLMEFDQSSKSILLWSSGGGKVYTFSISTKQLIRDDHSFHHKNQYSSGAFFDVMSKKIYLLGGYGLWSYKDYLTYYDPILKEWEIIIYDGEKSAAFPSVKSPRMTKVSPNRFLVHLHRRYNQMLQANSQLKSRFVNSIWEFDLASNVWTKKHSYPTPYEEEVSVQGFPIMNFHLNTYDSKSKLWYLIYSFKDFKRPLHSPQTFIYNVDTEQLYPFNIKTENLRGYSLPHDFIVDTLSQSAIMTYVEFSSERTNKLVIAKAPLLKPEELSGLSPIKETVPTSDASYISPIVGKPWVLLFTFLVLSGAGFSFYTYRKKNTLDTYEQASSSDSSLDLPTPSSHHIDPNIPIFQAIDFEQIEDYPLPKKGWIIQFEPDPSNPTLTFKGASFPADFPYDTRWFFILLLLLQEKYSLGIDYKLYFDLYGKPRDSYDSVRKSRSAMIRRLNSLFKASFKIENAIITSRSKEDKRRKFSCLNETAHGPVFFQHTEDLKDVVSHAPSEIQQLLEDILTGEFRLSEYR